MAKAYKKSARTYNTKVTPQSRPVPGKNQVANNAGGYAFAITPWEQLNRFLILGSEGGTYYVGEQKLTKENAKNVEACIKADGGRVVDTIVDVSDKGRAPKNDPALFALAMAMSQGDDATKRKALLAVPKVARIGTHLFHLADYVNEMRGWGKGLRKAFSRWYTERTPESLDLQVVKYQQRDGWSHRDILRLTHPKPRTDAENLAFKWVTGKIDGDMDKLQATHPLIYGYELVKRATDEAEVLRLVEQYKLPLEAIPTEKQTVKVLAQALPNMGITAVIRNLGRYTSLGIVDAGTSERNYVLKRITNEQELIQGRVHPLNVLLALKTYAQGRGMRGKLTWNPDGKVTDALDEAFYMAFKAVEPTGKRILLALDVSGSMGVSLGDLPISCREGTAAMAMVTARVEQDWEIVGFTSGGPYSWSGTGNRTAPALEGGDMGLTPLGITPRQRMDDVVRQISNLDFGGTDCSLPMLWAKKHKRPFDAIIIYTDSETWHGGIHPFQALKDYRQVMGLDTKLIVVGMVATPFSIADPSDAGMLDVVGFDTAAPNIMSEFIKGNL